MNKTILYHICGLLSFQNIDKELSLVEFVTVTIHGKLPWEIQKNMCPCMCVPVRMTEKTANSEY